MTRAKELEIKFAHERPDGSDIGTAAFEAGVGNPGGENIGAGFTKPEAVVKAWMDSDGHRTTMLQSHYTHIGVGYYKGKNGTGYWVQEFSSGPDEKCTLTVDANGGTFPSKGGVEKFEIIFPQGMLARIRDIDQPQKDGYTIQKWVDQYDCRVVNFCMDKDYTIHPVWVRDTASAQAIVTDDQQTCNALSEVHSNDVFNDGNDEDKYESNLPIDTTDCDMIDTEIYSNVDYDENSAVEFSEDDSQ